MSNRPSVGLAVIIKKDSKVLVGKRKNILGHGEWAFPGGHLESGEELGSAVKREITEEVGIKVKDIKFQTITNDIRENIETHYVTLFFTCDYLSGKVRNMEPHKCDGWEWVNWDFLIKSRKSLFLPIQSLLKQHFNPF